MVSGVLGHSVSYEDRCALEIPKWLCRIDMGDDTTTPDWSWLPILIRSQVIHSKFPIQCVISPPSNCYRWQFLLSSCWRWQSLDLEQWCSRAPQLGLQRWSTFSVCRCSVFSLAQVALFIRHWANRMPQSILFLRNSFFLFPFRSLHIILLQPSSTTHLKIVATNLACNRAAKPCQCQSLGKPGWKMLLKNKAENTGLQFLLRQLFLPSFLPSLGSCTYLVPPGLFL